MAGPCLDLLIATSGFREAPRCRLPETMCGAFFQARLVAPLPEFVAEALAAVGLAMLAQDEHQRAGFRRHDRTGEGWQDWERYRCPRLFLSNPQPLAADVLRSHDASLPAPLACPKHQVEGQARRGADRMPLFIGELGRANV